MQTSKINSNSKTRDLVETALLTALVFIATYWIQFQLPIGGNGGLVHLGTAMLFITSIVFGKKKGAISAAIGMALFDLLTGWGAWAPFTFVIRGIMGYVLGAIAYSGNRNGENIIVNTFAVILSGAWMIAGYYTTEVILYGNWLAPVASIPGDITQIVMALIIGIPMSKILKKYVKYI